MATSRKTRIASLIGAVAFVLSVGWSAASAMVQEGTVFLGAVLSFDGHHAIGGNHTYNGYELARERINSNGGVMVDGIRFMLGPYSSAMTKAVADVTDRYKVPLVAAEGASPDLFDGRYRYIFGLFSTAGHYFDGLIDLAAAKGRDAGKDPRELKLAIVVQNDRFSLWVRKAVFKDAETCGMEIIIDDKLPKIITGMSATLEKVKEQEPDILVVSGHSQGAEAVARGLKEMGIAIPVLAITHCEAARINERYPTAVEGAYCPAQWVPTLPYKDDLFGTARDFANAVKKAYPNEKYEHVPYQCASAAAALMVWKDAFERANSFDTEKLRAALTVTDLKTFYGRIRFAKTGEINSKPMVLRMIQNGKYVVVAPAK